MPLLPATPTGVAGPTSPATAYLASLAPSSRPTQLGALERVARVLSGGTETAATLPWHELTYGHALAVRTRLVEVYAPTTVRRSLVALRRTLREAWRLGLMTHEAYRRAVDLPAVHGDAMRRGRVLDAGELRVYEDVEWRASQTGDVRDQAMAMIAVDAGIRRAELRGLLLEHWRGRDRTMTVVGKRRSVRTVPVSAKTAAALSAWIGLRGVAPGPLFCRVTKYGSVRPGALGLRTVHDILAGRAVAAGLEKVSPHDLRRTMITDTLFAGADLSLAASLAGHRNVQTTRTYDLRELDAGRRALDAVTARRLARATATAGTSRRRPTSTAQLTLLDGTAG